MAGINIQKNYVTTSTSNITLANNWMVLVYGVTKQGTANPTLIQNYNTFLKMYGQSVNGVLTHAYMKFLLDNGVPVLFQRVIDTDKLVKAKLDYPESDSLFEVEANETYIGNVGNDIKVSLYNQGNKSEQVKLIIKLNDDVVETFNVGTSTGADASKLLYDFIYQASNSANSVSSYVNFKLLNLDESKWTGIENFTDKALTGGSEPENDINSAIDLLTNSNSSIYKNAKIKNAVTYYPQLRFVTTGGICSKDINTQYQMLQCLGILAGRENKTSFRVLVDFDKEMVNTNTVRDFVNLGLPEDVPASTYAFFGFWGADSTQFLPGSAGFLTALARSGYNVYNRRMAGTGFSPAFTKPYKEIYIDEYKDWQAEDKIQLNPIMLIDAQDNLAVMGSSTLAKPPVLNARNPEQALDIVCVGDYITAILNGIALSELEAALDRLSLSSLSNRISQEIDRFVASSAITRYDLTFNTTQIGKLGIECVLYFAIGLEEVSLTVTSVYDVNLL